MAAGDIACRPELPVTEIQCRHEQTALLAESLAPDAVALLGDLQYQNGELENFQTVFDPSWGRFNAIAHPVPGNHEYEGDPERDSAPGYYTYFGATAGDPAKGYYRWGLGDWTVFALNSGALGYTRTRDRPARRLLARVLCRRLRAGDLAARQSSPRCRPAPACSPTGITRARARASATRTSPTPRPSRWWTRSPSRARR